jgi:hypothetical protein
MLSRNTGSKTFPPNCWLSVSWSFYHAEKIVEWLLAAYLSIPVENEIVI